VSVKKKDFQNSLNNSLGAALGNKLGSVLGSELGPPLCTPLVSNLGSRLGELGEGRHSAIITTQYFQNTKIKKSYGKYSYVHKNLYEETFKNLHPLQS
jgi:hypothetical protein